MDGYGLWGIATAVGEFSKWRTMAFVVDIGPRHSYFVPRWLDTFSSLSLSLSLYSLFYTQEHSNATIPTILALHERYIHIFRTKKRRNDTEKIIAKKNPYQIQPVDSNKIYQFIDFKYRSRRTYTYFCL